MRVLLVEGWCNDLRALQAWPRLAPTVDREGIAGHREELRMDKLRRRLTNGVPSTRLARAAELG
ncbi:MAG: hypothetical protein OXU20_37550 [Myxococcales bacterium]|nr:hypothetical protein [Myxococcales bacterium]